MSLVAHVAFLHFLMFSPRWLFIQCTTHLYSLARVCIYFLCSSHRTLFRHQQSRRHTSPRSADFYFSCKLHTPSVGTCYLLSNGKISVSMSLFGASFFLTLLFLHLNMLWFLLLFLPFRTYCKGTYIPISDITS